MGNAVWNSESVNRIVKWEPDHEHYRLFCQLLPVSFIEVIKRQKQSAVILVIFHAQQIGRENTCRAEQCSRSGTGIDGVYAVRQRTLSV